MCTQAADRPGSSTGGVQACCYRGSGIMADSGAVWMQNNGVSQVIDSRPFDKMGNLEDAAAQLPIPTAAECGIRLLQPDVSHTI